MADIKVPKPPKSAFNPNRPASDLLKNQVAHLEWAIRNAGERRAGYRVKAVKTEADASARISALLPRLESAANLPLDGMPIPESVPAAPSKPVRRTAKRSVKRKPQQKSRRKVANRKAPKRKAKRAKR